MSDRQQQAERLEVLAGTWITEEDKAALRAGASALAREHEMVEALKVIRKAARGDEKGECWTIRKWLDKRDIFNDDIQGSERLIEEVCKAVLHD